jgi:hypothetical protein
MMSIMRKGSASFRMAVGAALVAVMAACTGHAAGSNPSSASVAPPVSTSAPTSPRPSPSSPYPADVPLTGHNVKPGEKPPLYPAAASSRSQAGANAFAEFFMRTLDWMYATTNPAYPKHYFASSCGLCSGLTTGMTKTAALNHFYEGGRFTVHPAAGTQIAPVTAPADYCASVKVDTTAEAVVDKTGKIFSGDGAYTNLDFKLCARYESQHWMTTYLARS